MQEFGKWREANPDKPATDFAAEILTPKYERWFGLKVSTATGASEKEIKARTKARQESARRRQAFPTLEQYISDAREIAGNDKFTDKQIERAYKRDKARLEGANGN
ncbi:MAG: hypothetical protein ACYTEQ_30600 [Planctomycetota bacterium]